MVGGEGEGRHLTLLPQKEMTACDGYLTANLCVYGHRGIKRGPDRRAVQLCQEDPQHKNKRTETHNALSVNVLSLHALGACMYMRLHTHTQLSYHDSGFVWVTITQGEMLRLLKGV